jgi:hypothetical protein
MTRYQVVVSPSPPPGQPFPLFTPSSLMVLLETTIASSLDHIIFANICAVYIATLEMTLLLLIRNKTEAERRTAVMCTYTLLPMS